ncbi:MAG: hypothetical protein H6700_11840 [Myxococcales bacterium]|nr:hypothetical protein [Myxococcales bacterium]
MPRSLRSLSRPAAAAPLYPAAAALYLAATSLVATGCGSTPAADPRDADVREDGDATDAASDPGSDTGADSDPDVVQDAPPDTGCLGPTPLCSFDCGGDFFESPSCEAGRWVCPPGTTPIDDCPPGSCFGLPLPGEVCDGGWQCRPWESGALPECGAPSEFVCADCRGFETPQELDGCLCSCDAGFVRCDTPGECAPTRASTAFGATITLDTGRCVFSLDELARGVEFSYTVEIPPNTPPVFSRPLDAGGCDAPDPSGLRIIESVGGGDQSWCICDTGLCMAPPPEAVPLEPGVYAATFSWNGRNWGGPSDTGQPEGPAFPLGDFQVTLRAAGIFIDADGSERTWDTSVSTWIRIVE